MRRSPRRAARLLRRAVVIGGIGAVLIRPSIPLRPHTVKSDDAPTAVLDGIRRRLEAHSDVVIADGERIVARFTGRAGILRYGTIELVSFHPDGIAFEHLKGPFRKCHERFEVTPSSGGGSSMTHGGAFTMRAGLFGWLLGISLVRRIFEQHVATHMAHHLSDRT